MPSVPVPPADPNRASAYSRQRIASIRADSSLAVGRWSGCCFEELRADKPTPLGGDAHDLAIIHRNLLFVRSAQRDETLAGLKDHAILVTAEWLEEHGPIANRGDDRRSAIPLTDAVFEEINNAPSILDNLARVGYELLYLPALDAPSVLQKVSMASFDESAVRPVVVMTPSPNDDCSSYYPPEPTEAGNLLPKKPKYAKPCEGVDVLVLDTGYIAYFDDPAGIAPVNARRDTDDDLVDGNGLLRHAAGHGSFVARQVRRYATAATIWSARVTRSGETGDNLVSEILVVDRLLDGLAACKSATVVVNMSFGGERSNYSSVIGDTIAAVLDGSIWPALKKRKKAVAFVAAAGNRLETTVAQTIPAGLPGVISVGANDREGVLYSTTGWDVATSGTRFGGYVAGRVKGTGRVFAAMGDPAVWRGTSFASPVIAAAIAALLPSGVTTRIELLDALETQYPEWISTY